MGILITESDTFWADVEIPRPTKQSPDAVHRIKVEYRHLPTDELSEFQTAGYDPVAYAACVEDANGDRDMAMILFAARLAQSGEGKKTSADRADELMQIMTGWKDVANADGVMEFNRESLIALLQWGRNAYSAIKDTYNRFINGEGRRGNSSASRSK